MSIVNESYMPPFVLWVLDGDDNIWKIYKGMESDQDFDKDAFLQAANNREFPEGTQVNNYIDARIVKNGALVEDVDVGVEDHTSNIDLIVCMTKSDDTVTFDYDVALDDVGQIVITPIDKSVSVTDLKVRTEEDAGMDVVDGNTRCFNLALTAHMIGDHNNFSYFMGVDDIGQGVITPEDETTSFISIAVNDSLDLVTEDLDPHSKEFEQRKDQCLTVINDIDSCTAQLLEKIQELNDLFKEIGITEAPIQNEVVEALTHIHTRRAEELSDMLDGYETGEIIEEALEDELDRHKIIIKFMQGELPLFSVDEEPSEEFVRLEELDDSSETSTVKYYYDPETESIISYLVAHEA